MVAMQDVKEDIKKTEIELFVINKVKEFRKAAKMSQRKLSMELRLGSSYVNRAENYKLREKYNLNHLNELSKIFNCSIADFLPSPNVEIDTINQYLELHPKLNARNEKMIKDAEEKGRKKREEKEKKGKVRRKNDEI